MKLRTLRTASRLCEIVFGAGLVAFMLGPCIKENRLTSTGATVALSGVLLYAGVTRKIENGNYDLKTAYYTGK